MKTISVLAFFLLLAKDNLVLYEFTKESKPEDWVIVDDVVMGGRSSGRFSINVDGHGVFSGNVSLENNGGFSSVRHQFPKVSISKYTKFKIRLKGDGKSYQFRIKDSRNAYYSYITTFQTSGNWETLTLEINDLYPSFRGQKLNMPTYAGDSLEEIAFLIGNKRNESFGLILAEISLAQ
jgi:NADH dehydrogenase [ubiquinone] 1 alpha subcomplex assembly factor 1